MKHLSNLTALLIATFLLTACGNDDGNHPAHDMGESADRINKQNSPAYQESRQQAAETGSMSHPAHEMDEVEALEKRGN